MMAFFAVHTLQAFSSEMADLYFQPKVLMEEIKALAILAQ
jgi:hypothetical protein